MERDLLIGTNNNEKLREIIYLIQGRDLNVYTPSLLCLKSPVEHGSSFKENAEIKALYYANTSGVSTLAEDSGLCIDILGGKPGIHTADWAIEAGSIKNFFEDIIIKIKKLDSSMKELSASFKVSFVYYNIKNKTIFSSEEEVKGRLSFDLLGESGFGFDAFFIPQGHTQTFAEMDYEKKLAASPRSGAIKKLFSLIEESC